MIFQSILNGKHQESDSFFKPAAMTGVLWDESESAEKLCIKPGFAVISDPVMIKRERDRERKVYYTTLLGKMKNNARYNRYFGLASTLETYFLPIRKSTSQLLSR